MSHVSDDVREAIDNDPFGNKAITFARGRRFTAREAETTVAPLLDEFHHDGFVIIRNLLAADQLAAIREEFDRLHGAIGVGHNSFGGYQTKQVFNLLARTRLFDQLILHRDVVALVEGLLDDQIQLSIASSITLGPGESAQVLHRDDSYYPIRRPHQALTANVLWALDDFAEDNGGTRFVPGSHLWDDALQPEASEISVAEIPAGSVLIWHGSLLHGAGSNATSQWRRGLSAIYARAWLRQQENQYLGMDPAQVTTLPRDMQRMLGYAMFGATMGNVDGCDPKHWLAERREP